MRAMSMGISTNYNNYNSYNSVTRTQQTSKTSQTDSTTTQKNNNEQDYLKELQDKYSSLNFTTGYNTKGTGSSGLGNVILHPSLTDKMADDPDFAAKVENNIKYIPQAEAWKKNMCAANGMNLISSGCFVDEDGNIAGSWSYVSTSNAGSDDNEKKELLEKLREKYSSEKDAIDKLMAARSEQKKQYEETLEFYKTDTNASAYMSNQAFKMARTLNIDTLT